jgi:hypothetical protein
MTSLHGFWYVLILVTRPIRRTLALSARPLGRRYQSAKEDTSCYNAILAYSVRCASRLLSNTQTVSNAVVP